MERVNCVGKIVATSIMLKMVSNKEFECSVFTVIITSYLYVVFIVRGVLLTS